MNTDVCKIALGTAQFGSRYGISNKQGQVRPAEVRRILQCAREHGVNTLDTAALYGQAEAVLATMPLSDFRVVTKTVKWRADLSLAENRRRFALGLENSCRLLAQGGALYACLIHEAADLLRREGAALWELLVQRKSEGRLHKIGVSVYTPAQLSAVAEQYDIDLVQLPLNMLDQRFLPWIPQLNARGIEVHARSVFLQGLLLLAPDEWSPWFDALAPTLRRIPAEGRLQMALDFALSVPGVDRLALGVTSRRELEEILRAAERPRSGADYTAFAVDDERFILPFNWQL